MSAPWEVGEGGFDEEDSNTHWGAQMGEGIFLESHAVWGGKGANAAKGKSAGKGASMYKHIDRGEGASVPTRSRNVSKAKASGRRTHECINRPCIQILIFGRRCRRGHDRSRRK